MLNILNMDSLRCAHTRSFHSFQSLYSLQQQQQQQLKKLVKFVHSDASNQKPQQSTEHPATRSRVSVWLAAGLLATVAFASLQATIWNGNSANRNNDDKNDNSDDDKADADALAAALQRQSYINDPPASLSGSPATADTPLPRHSLLASIATATASVTFTFKAMARFIVLTALFAPLLIAFPIWYFLERKRIWDPRLLQPAESTIVEIDTDEHEDGSMVLSDDAQPPIPNLWWIKWLAWTLELSGPSFIKASISFTLHSCEYLLCGVHRLSELLGQWASSRADMFPPWVCVVLSNLQANVAPHSFEHTRRAIENAFGAKLESIFSRFDPVPIGCGAIAQVHYAELRPEPVQASATDPQSSSAANVIQCAVKVLHPGVRDTIAIDLAIMRLFANIINAVIPGAEWLSIPEEASMFGSIMVKQLDLSNEADNLHIFRHNFKGWTSVGFPRPLPHLVTRDVLVETYLEAVPMTKFLAYGGSVFHKDLAELGLTSFLKMMLLDNHVHADLHPGNILVSFYKKVHRNILGATNSAIEFIHPSEVQKLRSATTVSEWNARLEEIRAQGYAPYMYMVDTGLVSSLSQAHLRNFIDLFQAIVEFNGKRIGELMISRSRSPWTVIDPEGFTTTMSEFLDHIKQQAFSLKNIHVADILGFVMKQSRQHCVKMEGDFVNIAISIMVLEGVGRQLEPSMDLLRASVPFLRKAVAKRLEGHVSTSEVSFWRSHPSILRTANLQWTKKKKKDHNQEMSHTSTPFRVETNTAAAVAITRPASVQEAWILFGEGIRHIFVRWTALQLAIDNDPYPRSQPPLDELLFHTLAFFEQYGNAVDTDDLCNNFTNYLEEQLEVEVEDGSTYQVARSILSLYQQVMVQGDASLVTRMREENRKTAGWRVSESKTVVEFSDDDDENDDEEGDAASTLSKDVDMASGSSVLVDADMDMDDDDSATNQRHAKPQPIIDEDGFELVVRKNRRR
eukprot:jgi/Hompol1/6460/HPOL_004991-RA